MDQGKIDVSCEKSCGDAGTGVGFVQNGFDPASGRRAEQGIANVPSRSDHKIGLFFRKDPCGDAKRLYQRDARFQI